MGNDDTFKKLESRYPEATGFKYLKKKGGVRYMPEEMLFQHEMFQSRRNWERHIRDAYDYIKEINDLVFLDDIRDAIIEIFSFKWAWKILKRVKHFLIYILVGKNVNRKKRKEDWKRWKNQRSSWIPGSTTRNS